MRRSIIWMSSRKSVPQILSCLWMQISEDVRRNHMMNVQQENTKVLWQISVNVCLSKWDWMMRYSRTLEPGSSNINSWIIVFKSPLCTASNLQCISSIKVDTSNCLQQCSGLMVTSYDQQEIINRQDIKILKIAKELSSILYNELNMKGCDLNLFTSQF